MRVKDSLPPGIVIGGQALRLVEHHGGLGQQVEEAVGGAAFLAGLAAAVPTAANVSQYARIVRDNSVLRAVASTATEIASSAYELPPNVDDFLDHAEHRIDHHGAESRGGGGSFTHPPAPATKGDIVCRLLL